MISPLLIVFDRSRTFLEVFARGPEWLTLFGKFPAANNTASNSRGPWPAGLYRSERLVRLPPGDDDPNGPYGAWFLRFIVPDRDGLDDAVGEFDGPGIGMGLHAGRRDGVDALGRSGYLRATMGCVRTTDEAMSTIAAGFGEAGGSCHLVVLD